MRASVFQRAGAVDFFRSQAEFFGDGELAGDAAAGVFVAEAAGAETLELLRGAPTGDYEARQIFVIAGFDGERGFDESGIAGAIARPFGKLPVDDGLDARMNDGVEASKFSRVGEDDGGELCAIDAIAAIQNGRAKFADHFFVRGLAGLDEGVREGIGVEYGEAHFAQHDRDRGLTTGDAPGEAEAKHTLGRLPPTVGCAVATLDEILPRRRRAAFTVLLMSMVMVMGPTPPGTGVSAPAGVTASGCTSPTSTEPFSRNFSRRAGKFRKKDSASSASVLLFVPTSITAAAVRIHSAPTM